MKNKLSDIEIEVAGTHRCVLGEGPVWDDVNQVICWLDIVNGEIHEYSVGKKDERTVRVHQMIGSIALCKNSNFIAGLQKGLYFIDRKTGKLTAIANPESHLTGNRFNDGKCDPAGRFWAGSMSFTAEPETGNVYLVDNQLNVSQKISNTTISNGMAWSSSKRLFYFIDSSTKGVDCFDYENETGNISNRRTVIKFNEKEGIPDGMTIDDEGMLWIAHWDGWQVSRWNPQTGKKLAYVKLPVARVSSCTFGGNDLQELYVTTAREGLSDTELKGQPLAGSLFVIHGLGVRGTIADRFNHWNNHESE